MNDADIVVRDQAGVAEVHLQKRSIDILRATVFPGVKCSDDMIQFAAAYAASLGVDLVRKPVHIVAYGGQPQIVPGIGLYRIIAMRSGHCGTSAPVYGPTDSNGLPEWCEITVKRQMPGGMVAEYTAREYMREANKGSPMWKSRPLGMLRVRAESQALRMAFPEVGAAPTLEELQDQQQGEQDEPRMRPQRKAAPSETVVSSPSPDQSVRSSAITVEDAQIIENVQHDTQVERSAPPSEKARAFIQQKLANAGVDVAWLSDKVGYALKDDLSNMTRDAYEDARRVLK